MREYLLGYGMLAAFTVGMICGGMVANKTGEQLCKEGYYVDAYTGSVYRGIDRDADNGAAGLGEGEVTAAGRVKEECFWGGDECVPGTNVACADCRDNTPTITIHGDKNMSDKSRHAIVKALTLASRKIFGRTDANIK